MATITTTIHAADGEYHWSAADAAGQLVAYGTDFHATPEEAAADAAGFGFAHPDQRPTASAALAYARRILPQEAILCGTVHSAEGPEARDVLFQFAGEGMTCRMCVWHDASCGFALYGEW